PSGHASGIAGLRDRGGGSRSHTQLEVNRAMDDERARAWTPEELLAVAAAQPMTSPPANDTSTPTPTPFWRDSSPPRSRARTWHAVGRAHLHAARAHPHDDATDHVRRHSLPPSP